MTSIDPSGYIYILQNNSHDNLVLKIGFTTVKPEVRAKQLYWGSTGVPEHFDIAVAFSVGDCKAAEAEVHRRLDSYRINRNREFFRIEPRVAQAVVLSTCESINKGLSQPAPSMLTFKNEKSSNYIKPIPEIPELSGKRLRREMRPITELKKAPVGTTVLTEAQVDRIKIVHLILMHVHNSSESEFIDNFSRDAFPEPELVIWENISKVYQEFDSTTIRNDAERAEAFKFILMSSMLSGCELEEMIEDCKLSYEDMMAIVNSMKR